MTPPPPPNILPWIPIAQGQGPETSPASFLTTPHPTASSPSASRSSDPPGAGLMVTSRLWLRLPTLLNILPLQPSLLFPGPGGPKRLPTLDLRVFQQEQEGVADRGADGHRPREQQIDDSHQHVLVSEFCVWITFLLEETGQRGSENTTCRWRGPPSWAWGSTASSSLVKEFK